MLHLLLVASIVTVERMLSAMLWQKFAVPKLLPAKMTQTVQMVTNAIPKLGYVRHLAAKVTIAAKDSLVSILSVRHLALLVLLMRLVSMVQLVLLPREDAGKVARSLLHAPKKGIVQTDLCAI